MRRIAAVGVALVATLALLSPQTVLAQDAGLHHDPGKEAAFVGHINGLRSQQGLAPLEVHEQLVNKARDWSRQMAAEGRIWHSNLPDGITTTWQRLGENVGTGGSVDALHQAFIDSPKHYDNLVDPGFQHVGIGVTVDAEGTIFVSEMFMELAAPSAPSTPAPSTGTSAPEVPGPPPPDPPPSSPPPPVDEEAGDQREPSRRLESILLRLRTLEA